MTNVTVQGPFWSAVVDFANLVDVKQNSAVRNLFLDRMARSAMGTSNMHLPGTQIALCFVKSVSLEPGNGKTYSWALRSGDAMPAANLLTPGGIRSFVASGELALLLIQSDPEAWPTSGTNYPPVTCIAGEILLDGLAQQGNARNRLFEDLELSALDASLENVLPLLEGRSGSSGLLGEITVHASGVSLFGQVQLPWEDSGSLVQAPFLAARNIPDDDASEPAYTLQPEYERFTDAENDRWSAAWLQLSRDLNPRHPLNGITVEEDEKLPHWVSLEIVNPRNVPELYWDIAPWATTPTLNFAEGQVSLILSDRQPYDPQNPPVSLARIVPETILVMPADSASDQLQIKLGNGEVEDIPTYQWGQLSSETFLEDQLRLQDLDLAFNPIETPDRLRTSQNLPRPDWSNRETPLDPAAVWGYMPLENGWAQLPVPNFTEQIFLDSEQENPNSLDEEPTDTSQLRGVVAFGNEDNEVLNQHPDEQPWNLTITRLETARGVWTLSRRTGEAASSSRRYQLDTIELDIIEPEIIINGLFWMSTGKPRTEDALPDLEDWVRGLASIPLRNHKPDTDLFPSPIFFRFEEIVLKARDEEDPSAKLSNWNTQYEVDEEVFTSMTSITPSNAPDETWRLLPEDFFSLYKAWAWLRHPALPMIQALPLTQNDLPPNYPNRSRQLVPFEFAIDASNRPVHWAFGVDNENGASSWPTLIDEASTEPASEWTQSGDGSTTKLYDLPLVSLSLPGVVFDPNEKNPNLDGSTIQDGGLKGLNPQLRFDLPYTDQVNALAQLPPEPKTEEEISPLPESEPPEPPAPLTRDSFAEHWLRMSERASLARADATDAIKSDDSGNKTIQNLIEPLEWPLSDAQINDSSFPGEVSITGQDSSDPLVLKEDDALRGISGSFEESNTTPGTLVPSSGDGAAFEVEAGSMAARSLQDEEDLVWYRDQRGLSRSASDSGTNLIKTPVELSGPSDNTRYELTSARTTFELHLEDHEKSEKWNFWFRDLPVLNNTFTRSMSATASGEKLDINDPESLSRERNFLTGYEWRLGSEMNTEPLPLFGLQFYPLTLVQVVIEEDFITEIQMDGRLQLPLEGPASEQTAFRNAVRLVFTSTDEGELQLSTIKINESIEETPVGVDSDSAEVTVTNEWPLALKEEELTNAPVICWDSISLAGNALHVDGVSLKFFRFEAEWNVTVPTLAFSSARSGPAETADGEETEAVEEIRINLIPEDSSEEESPKLDPLTPTVVFLTIDTLERKNTALLTLSIELGTERNTGEDNASRGSFSALVDFDLLANPGEGSAWESATLFDDVELETDSKRFLVRDTSMQFQWTQEKPQTESSEPSTDSADLEGLQLLPGMFLRPGDAPGFTALTFHSESGSNGIPKLILDTAFIEVLLHCQWSRFLQESPSTVEATSEGDPIYDSSAGDLFFGYTAEWKGEAGWEEVLLLNGFLEVKNLVSWPASIQLDEGKTNLTLPPFQDKTTLDHYRHSIRILFNQHQVPVNLTVVGSGNLLFQFNQAFSWQFLAVVEHQVVEIKEDNRLGLERRWTTVQEIRLASPTVFKAFLQEFDQANTVLPDSGTGSIGSHSYGYLSSAIRSRLAEGADAELDKMAPNSFIVEASAPHWINLKSISGASETTLQFLPNGTQVGILSQPDYYSPSDPRDPEWLLLSLPFIGRLQNESAPNVTGSDTPLHIDPIKHLLSGSSDKSLALNFASWAEDEPITIAVSGFDTSAGRTWARLDPNTLRESWFRIQHPQQEEEADGLRSVMASLPDTPARMSRSVALRQLFDTYRVAFPPTEVSADEDDILSDTPTLVSPNEPLEWRPDSWLAPQEISSVTTEDNPDGLLALYTFEEGEGTVVRDRSGSANPLDLHMQKRVGSNWVDLDATDNHAQWIEGGGLEVVNPMILRSLTPAAALSITSTASGEITIEAWIRPANIEQGINDQARIVSIADSTSDRNITMGYKRQGTSSTAEYDCSYRLAVGGQLQFKRIVPTGSAVVEDRIHVAYVHKQTGESIMYFDGQEITRRSDEGTFANWMEDFPLVLANELNGSDVPWRGVYFLVAIYGVALEPEEILAHVQAGTIKGRSSINGYKWYNPGLHLLDSNLIRTRNELSEPLSHLVSHHAAATALPASLQQGENPSPVSFAVSPYLGLGFKAAIDEYNPLLVSAELLCLDQVSGVLSPVASRFLNAGENSETGSAQEESIKWGKETHQKLCPESPFAILRFREINERGPNADIAINQAAVTATYSYAILTNLAEPERFARRVFPLRSTVKELRFREGQFGGYHPPSPGATIDQVEIAPPQTVGVQPLYIKGIWRIFDASDRTRYTILITGDQAALYALKEDPDSSAETLVLEETLTDNAELKALTTALQKGNGILDTTLSSAFPETFAPPSSDDEEDSSEEDEEVSSSDKSVHRAWPWGLSALRLEIAYTEDGKGVIGTLDPSETSTERTLWWQSHSYQVQFRSALADQPVAGLPPYFRAPAIKGLLPVLPDPPMPKIAASSEDTFNSEASISERWQAILPGVLRFMITGDRPGVPFAFRSHIISQRGFSQTGASAGQTLVSGGTPVQHKMPRPTPLPLTGRRDVALQTWSSFFAPEKLLLAETLPVDEAFFSRCEAFDALAYQVKLSNPAPGSWTSEWNTELVLDIQIIVQGGNWPLFRQYFLDKALDTVQPGDEPEDPDSTIASLLPELIHEWVSVEITDGDQSFTYTYTGQPNGTEYTFRISENDQSAFDALLGSQVPGGEIHVLTHIGNERFTSSYRQSLAFPMRRVDEDKFRLPLKPFYIHFEDPEYNRRLTSAATQATRNIKTLVGTGDDQDRELTTVTLATDRKEYNPDSLLSVRYDWETNYDGSGHLKIEKIEASSGNPIRLFTEEMRNLNEEDKVFDLRPKTLLQIPLNKLEQNTGPAALSGGTTLQLTLTITAVEKVLAEDPEVVLEGEQIIVLNVDIVDENVIPKPEAAYALLRALDDTAAKVECARFAWGPESNRIDLLCPDDLRTGIVRRRAVFNWSDVVRYTQFKGYSVQKITQSGSTHFPSVEDFIID